MKYCNKCMTEKNKSEFSNSKRSKDGLHTNCKSCDAAYYQENIDRKLAYQKQWAIDNQDKKKAQRKSYKDRANFLEREKRKNDPVFAMQCRVRARVRAMQRDGRFKKDSATEVMLGCTWLEFSDHLERQFLKGMSWCNRSEWHIDHIIPLASAKTPQEVLELCHHTNMRPLWAKDNFSKSARVNHLI